MADPTDLPRPSPHLAADGTDRLVLALLVVSAGLLAVAPLFVPDGYSWVRHTTSESAGQLVHGAWVARTGFVCFGLAVLSLAHRHVGQWGVAGSAAHGIFGVSMLASAVFSTRSWVRSAPFDRTEDLLHSIASFGVGMGFIAGVALVSVRRSRSSGHTDWPSLAALVVVVACLGAMSSFADAAGAFQRMMFSVAFVWYGYEAMTAARSTGAVP